MEAISHAGTSMGILANDGIVLAAEKRMDSKLLDKGHVQDKIYTISDDILCCVAGITSDANTLIDHARLTCQRHKFKYGEEMPVEQLVQSICDLKQSYTQHGGMRPFGVSFLFAGWDKEFGFQLYQSDPSGNYGGWKAVCIGSNSGSAQSMFKTEYPDEGFSLEGGANDLIIKALDKTIEGGKLCGEKLEVAILCRSNNSTTIQTVHTCESVDTWLSASKSSMEVA